MMDFDDLVEQALTVEEGDLVRLPFAPQRAGYVADIKRGKMGRENVIMLHLEDGTMDGEAVPIYRNPPDKRNLEIWTKNEEWAADVIRHIESLGPETDFDYYYDVIDLYRAFAPADMQSRQFDSPFDMSDDDWSQRYRQRF